VRAGRGADAMDGIFVGRRPELSFLHDRLAEVRAGAPRAVLLEGAAGVGKTALLGEFLARADCHRSFKLSGEELEANLAYGLVEQLVAEAGEPLPERLTALDGGGAAGADPVRVGLGIVDLLGRLQLAGPVVLVVDDAHWADLASLQALTFALRRLRSDRVLALLSVRGDAAERLPPSLQRLVATGGSARLPLGGLDVNDLRALATALGAGPLSRQAAARLRDHTGGNVLHARALLEELPAEAFRYNARPLPVPRSFRMLVLARLATCPPDAEQLVVAAAVLGSRCPLMLASRLGEVEDPLVALERAIGAHLLEEQPTAADLLVAFPHPLVRASVYHDLGPARRASLHARAAQLLDGGPAVLRHRVAAARGPDPELAAEVAALASRQAMTGSCLAAAESLLAAARLSATSVQRERLVLEAVEQLLLGGSASEATAFGDELARFTDGARRDYVLARLALVAGRHTDADRLLRRAWEHGDLTAEPELARAIAEQLALHGLIHARARQAMAWARRARTAGSSGPSTASNLLDVLTVGLVMNGLAHDALTLNGSLTHLAVPAAPAWPDGLVGRGIARLWTDDLAGAYHDLSSAQAAYQRHQAPLPWGLIGLTFLAETEYRLGEWDDATSHAELAVSIARDADQDWLAPFAHAIAAFPLAARGVLESAATHAKAATTSLRAAGTESSTVWVATAAALVALAEGDVNRVVAVLEPVRSLPDRAAAVEPSWRPWRALYAEAQVALGRCDEAEAVLLPLEALAAVRRPYSSLLAAGRARGALEAARGHPRQAEAAFRAGLACAAELPMPFERALLEAAYGRFLRRTGRRAEAARLLEAAGARFAQLGARPFLDRCRHELGACGHTLARRRAAGPGATLTPQELAVSRLVAAGRTNREAAAELVVSVKTIEYHLGNAYAKLGVTSRTQLTLQLGRTTTGMRTEATAVPMGSD
jgi:DNA-binding CsgD family transcriptional regulator